MTINSKVNCITVFKASIFVKRTVGFIGQTSLHTSVLMNSCVHYIDSHSVQLILHLYLNSTIYLNCTH